MKYIKCNEQGYTLLIVLLAVVLFMVMGASLFMLNMSGVSKNESRESHTQAQDLAVKGLDYVVKEIEYKMENLAAGGLSPNQFEVQFKNVLDSYKCDIAVGSLQNTETGSATYCIEKYQDTTNATPHLKKVTFRSIGEANEREYTTQASYLLGSSVSDEFEYALLTYGNDPSNPNKTDTTGNIELHGGLQVKGDIYSDNVLISSKSSRFKNTLVPTVGPFVESTIINPMTNKPFTDRIYQKASTGNGVAAKIVTLEKLAVPHSGGNEQKLRAHLERMDDKQYKQMLFKKPEDKNDYEYNKEIFNPLKATHLEGNIKVDFNIVNSINAVRREFYESPASDRFRNDVTPLQTGYIGLDYLGINYYRNYALLSETRSIGGRLQHYGATVRNLSSNAEKVYVRGYAAGTSLTDEDKFNWEVYSNNELKNVAFPMNLRLKHGVKTALPEFSTAPVLKVKKAYIEKDMVVGLNTSNESNFGLLNNFVDLDILGITSLLEGTINFDTPVHLEGIYYVNGDLTISTTRLTGDATFFVKGKTNIEFSDVGVTRSNLQEESNINILSHGPVNVRYISNNHNNDELLKQRNVYKDDIYASTWKGHIHSDEKIIVDGATSNLIINGSMSGKEIEITSIKGRTQPGCRKILHQVDKYVVDGVVEPLVEGLLLGPLVKPVLDLLTGAERADDSYNMILAKNGINYHSNCFEMVANQYKEKAYTPATLIRALGLPLLSAGQYEHEIQSRVQINYNPEPIDYLKEKFNIEYEGTPKITQLDPPKAISRD